jgi:predicted MFS family arabinose efflux permease
MANAAEDFAAAESAHKPLRLARLIPGIGIAQIISWGTLFYAVAVLGEPMRRDLALSSEALYGAVTLGLFVSGFFSPLAGRLVDARGGRIVLAAGSVLAALALALLATARGVGGLYLGWAVAGVAMAACLYDPAFATLHQLTGPAYRRAVTALTLFGGFASTVFWPASQWLLDSVGWRMALWIYVALHVLVCLPLHLLLLPSQRPDAHTEEGTGEDLVADGTLPTEPLLRAGRAAFHWLAAAFALAALLSAALSIHLITLLKDSGLEARDAVLVSALIGPMQVAGRIAEFFFMRRVSPLAVGTFAFVLMATAMVALMFVAHVAPAAIAFAILYGWSNGVMTIVRGTVPAVLFGRRRYGSLLGRLALPSFVAKAVAPLAFALTLAVAVPRALALSSLLVAALLALAAYHFATRPGKGARSSYI